MKLQIGKLILVLQILSTSAFFKYEKDCIKWCTQKRLPCLITELSPNHFPCDCFQDAENCKENANDRAVCLLPDGKSFGGNDIWIDYYNYTHPYPPVPIPTPKIGASWLQIYAAVVTTILVVYGGSNLIGCLDRAWRRRQYQRLGRNQPSTDGVPISPESPYSNPTAEI